MSMGRHPRKPGATYRQDQPRPGRSQTSPQAGCYRKGMDLHADRRHRPVRDSAPSHAGHGRCGQFCHPAADGGFSASCRTCLPYLARHAFYGSRCCKTAYFVSFVGFSGCHHGGLFPSLPGRCRRVGHCLRSPSRAGACLVAYRGLCRPARPCLPGCPHCRNRGRCIRGQEII